MISPWTARSWPLLLAAALQAAGAAELKGPPRASGEPVLPGRPPAPVSLEIPALGPERLPEALLASAPSPLALPSPAVPALPAAAAKAGREPAAALPGPLPFEPVRPGADPAREAAAARALFDEGAAGPRPPLPALSAAARWLVSLLPGGERVPAWPGRAGEKVRVGGRTWTLGRRLGSGNTAAVWATEPGFPAAVKLVHPDFRDDPLGEAELEALKGLARTDIPHAELLAASRDGSVLVKELIDGPTGAEALAEGPFDGRRLGALADLAARLIRLGHSADLHPGNLAWDRWRGRWALVDAGGLIPAPPERVLGELLAGPWRAGLGPGGGAELLSAVRGRLGPASTRWRETAEALRRSGNLRTELEALIRRDRRFPPLPALEFGAAPAHAVLDEAVLSWPALVERLGYNPLLQDRELLSRGERETSRTYLIRPAGEPPAVLKLAERGIVARELFLRRVIRRWFGGLLEAPPALGYLGSSPAVLVMREAPGWHRRRGDAFGPEARVALALLAQTFGLLDTSEENVLSGGPAGPVLIDFEHSLMRRPPNPARIPDDAILAEMPWVSRVRLNRVEDYLPSVARWKALLARPETREALRAMLLESGFTPRESEKALAVIGENAADLGWALQTDVEFANFTVGLGRPGGPR